MQFSLHRRARFTSFAMSLKSARYLLLVALLLSLGFLAKHQAVPPGLALKGFDPEAIAGLLTWLFTVALFIERAVEVIVMVLRDAEADHLSAAVENEKSRISDLRKADPKLSESDAALIQAQRDLTTYRAATKSVALIVALLLGTLVSLAGVRALGSLLVAPGSHWLYTTADVLITGAVLAGGSEGIHQMANVITNFLQSAADKAKAKP